MWGCNLFIVYVHVYMTIADEESDVILSPHGTELNN